MERVKKQLLSCGIFAGLFILLLAVCLIMPSMAHIINSDRWTGTLYPVDASPAALQSNLLAEGGQTVLIREEKDVYEIPITVNCDRNTEDIVTGSITVTSNNPSLTASLDKNGVALSGTTAQSFTLVLTPVKEQKADMENPQTAEMSATVSCVCGDSTISAVFVLPGEGNPDEVIPYDGTIEPSLSQYNKEIPITLTVSDKAAKLYLKDGDFPPMTRYIVGDKSTVLYDGGEIALNAGTVVKLDLSKTTVSGDLVLSAASKECTLKYVELPKLDNEDTLVMDASGLVLPIAYRWGDIVPEVRIERLHANENGDISWAADAKITWRESDDKVQLVTNEAEAGTYRVIMEWKEDNEVLYSIETDVFVRYE